MASTKSAHTLIRVVSSILIALAATVLSTGYAQAATPATARAITAGLDPHGPDPVISVLLADQHVLFRSGLRAAILTQPDFRCVAEVGDGAAAIAEMRRQRPHIAILDLDMPGLDEAAIVETVAELANTTRILTLTSDDTEENLYRALRLGATGFLSKALPAQDLIAAIRTAARGDALIDPRLTRSLITRLTTGIEPFPAAPELRSLTAREHEVLQLIAKAYTNPEIAAALGVGEQTVKTHVSNVLTKLGVRDRVQAAVYAHTRRIVT